MVSRLFKKTTLNVMLILCLAILAQCASDNQAITLGEVADNSSGISDGGSFSPDADGSTNVCEKDEEGNCIDDASVSSIMLSNQQLDFGMSELEAIECQSIGLPSSVTYQAEVDQENTSVSDGESEFAIRNASGGYSEERVTGSGDLTICYMRNATGTHTGQIKVVLNAASATSSAYAYVIKTKGQTLAPLFTIQSPTQGQIIDSRSDHNEGVNSAEGDYLLTVSGKVNLDLQAILANGTNSEILINADSVKYKTTFDASGNFSKQIGVPQVQGLYDITLSIDTTKGSPLSKTVTVVVAGSPTLEIEVRNTSGLEIDTTAPTDVPELIVGIRVPNLYVSGSSETEMPVTLYDIEFNGQALHTDTEVWYSDTWSWCENKEIEADAKDNGFDARSTLCIPLSNITELQDGINTISAKAKNILGQTSAQLTLIIDNDKPIIQVNAPRQNQLFAANTTSLHISGTVKYFAPIEGVVPTANNEETGSYCQPTKEEDPDCPASSVKLWVNVSTSDDNYPINIYPSYSGNYSSVTTEQSNSYMETDSNGQGNCYTQTTTVENEDGTEATSEKTVCDVPEGKFDFILEVPSTQTHAILNLYTNVIELQAESVKGHRSIEVVTFQLGETSSHTRTFDPDAVTQRTATLNAGQLGVVEPSCGVTEDVCVNRAPVMLNVSEGIIDNSTEQGKKIIAVVENYLNKNLSFADVANGWMYWPKDDNGNISLEADYQKQWIESADSGGKRYDDFEKLPMGWKKKFVQQGLHSNIMVMKYWALWRYRQILVETTNGDCSQNPSLCFFEREGNPETEYNVALDSCGEVITTAFVPIGDMQYWYEAFGLNPTEYTDNDEWPVFADSYDYNDFISGKWIVQKLDLKDNGYIDADVCLVPNDPNLENAYLESGCDADVSSAREPAFWGQFISYNLVEKGLLGPQEMMGFEYSINDDTIPLFWNIGKLRLQLGDIIQIKQEELNGTWTNKVDIIGENFKKFEQDIVTNNTLSDLFDSTKMRAKTIQIESFQNCVSYFNEHYPGYFVPFGCDENPDRNYPFVLDRNSPQGQTVYSDLTVNGTNSSFLGIIWWGVLDTFRKMVSCMDEEMINPMISSHYDYPSWVWEGNAFSTNFEWEEFNFGANIENADLNIFDGGVTLRMPLTVGVDGVPFFNLLKGLSQNSSGLHQANLKTIMTYEQANTKGHLRRSSANTTLENYPLVSDNPHDDAFLGISLNIEEIVNAAAYLIFKKGPMSLLSTFDIDEVTANDNWSVGVDKVILGRFDICDIAGLIPSELPPSLLFATIQSLFNESSLHLDVLLDSDYPITLSLKEIEGLETGNASEIQLGLTNVQIAVKELRSHLNDAGEVVANVYDNPATDPEMLRVQLDGVIKIRAVYHKEAREIHVYIPPYADQNIHVSVPSGHNGPTYDDVNVVTDVLKGVIMALFDKMGKDVYEDMDDNGSFDLETANPTLKVKLKGNDAYGTGTLSLSSLEDFEIELNVEAFENASCGDDVPYYTGEEPLTFTFDKAGTVPLVNPQNSLSSLYEHLNDDDDNPPFQVSPHMSDITIIPKNPCDLLYPTFMTKDDDGKLTKNEDPLRDALCDFGIKDVVIDPAIVFDNEQGYIHVSSELFIELESWLKDD